VDGQAGGLGKVHGHEIQAASHELGDERDVTCQPVELGDPRAALYRRQEQS